MKLVRIASIIALVLVLALVGAGVGCGGNGGGGAANMMSMIPEDASKFMLVDIKALRGDDDLEDLYEDMMGDIEGTLATFGIDVDDVHRVAGSGETLLLLDGAFDLDEVRDALEDQDFGKGEYKDVEVWEDPSGSGWVALMRDLIVIGNKAAVEDCIEVIQEGEDSLQDNPDAREVMAGLPGGVVMGMGIGEAFSEIIEEEYQDLEAGGMSLGKKDKDTLNATAILRFEDEGAAEDATDEIEDSLAEEGFKNIDIEQDKELVTVTAEIGIDDFLNDMDSVTAANDEAADVKTAAYAYLADNDGWPADSTVLGSYLSGTLKAKYYFDSHAGFIDQVDSVANGWTGVVFDTSDQEWVMGDDVQGGGTQDRP